MAEAGNSKVTSSSPTISNKEFDVSIHMGLWLGCFPFTCGGIPYKTTLLLDEEEVTKTDVDLCGRHVSKRPYGELGSVDRSNCCCCVSVSSAFGPISPGCGCEAELVDSVVTQLKERMRTRGDTAQIQRAEQTLERLDAMELKLDAIMSHLNIPASDKMEDRA